MKKIIITLSAFVLSFTAYAQDSNVLIGIGAPVYGVKIKANFPGVTGGWARGYYVVNQNNSNNFLGFGVLGSANNGIAAMDYGWIGKDYNEPYMSFLSSGRVGIGTTKPSDMLTVAGKIGAREIKVSTNAGADFVFEPDYKLPDLKTLEKFIKTHKHLPEISTAKEMVENGVNLGELNIKLLQKVEELTLHLIEKDKQLQNGASLIKNQQMQIDELKKGYLEIKQYLSTKRKN